MIEIFGKQRRAQLESEKQTLQKQIALLERTNRLLQDTNQIVTTANKEYLAQKDKPRILDENRYDEFFYGNRILVVDDEEFFQGQVGGIALAFGFQPSYANSVKEALKEIDGNRLEYYKIIITDGDMPTEDDTLTTGLDLISRIRANQKLNSLEIVMYSGNNGYRQEVEKLGGKFINKIPYELAAFFYQKTTIF